MRVSLTLKKGGLHKLSTEPTAFGQASLSHPHFSPQTSAPVAPIPNNAAGPLNGTRSDVFLRNDDATLHRASNSGTHQRKNEGLQLTTKTTRLEANKATQRPQMSPTTAGDHTQMGDESADDASHKQESHIRTRNAEQAQITARRRRPTQQQHDRTPTRRTQHHATTSSTNASHAHADTATLPF